MSVKVERMLWCRSKDHPDLYHCWGVLVGTEEDIQKSATNMAKQYGSCVMVTERVGTMHHKECDLEQAGTYENERGN
jgi:hypothetical protein